MDSQAMKKPSLSVREAAANRGISISTALVFATLASVAATAGDFLMLYVVNAGDAALNLPPYETAWLPIGYFLGILAIPLYGLGFWAIAKILSPSAPRAGRVVLVSGVIMAVFGGIIHGVTGITIESQIRTGGAQLEPLAAILEYDVYLLPLWTIASILSVIGAIGFAIGVVFGKTIFSRFIAAFNPVLLTLCIGIAGSSTPLLQVFLIPAAPNIAHALFFGMITLLFFKNSAVNVK